MKTILTSLVAVLLTVDVWAQQATIASGGDASGIGGSLSYTVGQIAYSINTGTSGAVSQGVQQPYEFFTIGVQETELNISISIYPNPTSNFLILQLNDYNNEKLSYQLFDIQGKLLCNAPIITSETQINTASLPPAIYFINVLNKENRNVQSIKIIKN